MTDMVTDKGKAEHFAALLEVTKALGSENKLDNLLELILDKTTIVMSAERSSLFLYDKDSNELWSKIAQGAKEIRFPVGKGIAGSVAATLKPENIQDAYEDERFNPEFDKKSNFRTKAVLCLPMIGAHAELVGVIQVLNKTDGGIFTKEDEELLAALGGQAAVALQRAQLVEIYVENQKLEETLKMAHNIQMSLLPKTFPPYPEVAHLIDIYASLTPAKDVGGDLYDFKLLDEDHLAFAVGDVSGKGVPAALFMAVTKTLLKATADKDLPPSETLVKLNDFLSVDNEADMFCTFFFGILNLKTGHIRYSNGGHNPAYIIRKDGSFDILKKPIGTALGLIEGLSFEPAEAQLQKGDTLFMYTDGVNEAMSEEFEEFSYPRMEESLRRVAKMDAKGIVEAVLEDVKAFAGKAPQSDDITLLVLRYLEDN